mgnify:CR=1 FL=1
MGRLSDEVESYRFFYVEKDRQQYLANENLFGEQVAKAFPSAEADIQDAGRCLAFNRWTASVFHSMRVLEIGLNALAKELNDTARADCYANYVREGLGYQLPLQVIGPGNESAALGGFRGGDGKLRVDRTQHAVSAIMGACDAGRAEC